ncbi:MAG: SMI1/KNR4 family protein [Bacteroidetes bacterium]|nr:SMI1/KNR4 family protein [Bacteroidota bacterium]
MTQEQRASILKSIDRNPPAEPQAIIAMQHEGNLSLPDDYIEFLKYANGGEGPIGSEGYIMLWRIEELIELNSAYQVAEYAPGLFLIGSDGSGDAFAFDTRSNAWSVVALPFVGMSLDLASPLASTFDEFLEFLHTS